MSTLVYPSAKLAQPSHDQHEEERRAVGRVSQIYREFLGELWTIARGASRPLVKTDEDCEGADFAFILEVSQRDYERVVHESSVLEAKYFAEHGVNFVVIPEVM